MVYRSDKKIVIVGAGIGGVTLAAQLSSLGIECDIYEQRKLLSEAGFGLNIQPTAVSILYRLGLSEQLNSVGIQTKAHRYVDHLGTLLFEEARGIEAGFDTPQISISRAKLLNLIFSMVKDKQDFHFGSAFSGEFFNKSEWANKLIVGADGIHSVVRQALFPNAMKLNSGGIMLWRGMTIMPRLLDGRTMIIANGENGIRLVAYSMSKSHDLCSESFINWVILVPMSYETLPNTTINRFQATNFLLDLLKEWHFDWLDLRTLITMSKTIMRTAMVDKQPLEKWSHSQGVLLGDAAHPMFPVGANGATQSIIDAETLAYALYEYPDFESAIAAYEYIRIPAVSKIVMANRKMNERDLMIQSLNPQDRSQEIATTTSNYETETINDIFELTQ
ncbi:FAD-dependent monooxygenase [Xenorhabdus bovienii]|uniref:FAD-dependent monooxygenase n=1 Tax=Xenorhabdus bovienii TaxID=40576 RepID=UPI00237CE3A8|nr:FAD-dependent monooxygenase [Xenorhabdus bovienii]MDE1488545.1 FAD-dependent monooxygenase [Xenorhabdus bovienii]MDE1497337.1 FAD-dependent monooxygenase [Xenorhabdus bovienii]MDE9475341.1 FAD-dependent monooxygenase [Xenorhabdus bovienii]MDE9479417.1 FAD-dependent monooxygenase [Xenorhabdus bovienii]MDE9532254.1 FAD-dependent monooxygenase [Xenorhabdus bovienii]